MKILFTPLTGSSIAHVVRSLAIATVLKDRGHDVAFTSDISKKKFIEKQGYQVINITPTINLNDPKDQSINYIKKYKNKFIQWFTTEIETTLQYKPDLVISAGAILGPYIYYSTNIKVIGVLDVQYLDESLGLIGSSLASNRLTHRTLRTILHPIFKKKFINLYFKEIISIYEQIGIKPPPKTRKELYEPMPIIIPSDELLEPLREIRPNTIYSGPLFWNGFNNLSDLTYKSINDFKKNSKLIYITFGGSIFDKNLYNKIIETLNTIDAKKIICLGPNWQREDFPPDTDTMLIRKFVPGELLSEMSDIIINTGSQGAVSQALKYGKPIIAFPTNIDQSFYANRIEELKVGININKISLLKFSKRENFSKLPNNLSKKIKIAINKLIQNPMYRRNAQYHKNIITKYMNPPQIAVNFIEKFL